MTLENFITALEKEQIKVRLVDGQLQVSAPKQALSSALIQELKERKEEVVNFLNKMQSRRKIELIPVLPVAEDYEVSHAQKRLWLLDQFGIKSPYNLPLIYDFEGLDHQVFIQAFTKLIKRHEILRTRFVNKDGEPRQVVVDFEEFPFEVKFQRCCETVATELLTTSAMAPFNLQKGPLLRVELLQIGEDHYRCLICLHHIITDGWSLDVMFEELIQFYNEIKTDEQASLPDLRIQYKDFASWQNGQLNSGAMAESKAFWESQFAEKTPVWEFPFSKNRPKMKAYEGATTYLDIDPETASILQQLSSSYDTSKFTVFLATIKALIYRYTNVNDLTLGSVFADRMLGELVNQIGFYVNTLALRTRMSADESFVDLLLKVKQSALEAYRHQGYPFDCLIDALDIERDTGRHPLFDVLVLFENEKENTFSGVMAGGARAQRLPLEETTSKYDMTFTLIQKEQALKLKIEYSKALFDEADIRRLMNHYQTLIHSIGADNTTALNELNFLPEEERIQILTTFNDTETYFPADKTFHALIEEQAQKNPENTALVFRDKEISYAEMDARANQLANFLIEKYGVSKGEAIGIKVSRSEEMIIGLLGILKTGGAYVPIATNTPEKRVSYIVKDAGIRILLGEESKTNGCEWINLHETLQRLDAFTTASPNVRMTSDDLAYIIYTSGSTGMPKGVMVGHKGVVNRLYWMWKQYNFRTSSAILQKTSYTFDVSVGEIFTALCFGARLVLCPEEKVADPLALVEEIERNQVTTVHFVPSMFNVFLDAFEPEWVNRLASIEHVFASGEALLPEAVRKYYSFLNAPLHNLYGPTEASVEVTHYTAQRGDTVIPIGQPISNIRMYVLGQRDELVPIGVWGEVCIAGVGLAYGYVNKEELTNDRFVPNPYEPGNRLYRTGDIGRWTADGHIEYKGRKDFQVKIRGFRIELGEIENVLLGLQEVEHVVAIVDGEGESKRIVAYYSGKNPVDTALLDRHVKKHVPDYMVPALYIYLDAIPLSSSGKVDRAALPEPAAQEMQGQVVLPVNDMEEVLVNIWQEVLQLDQLSTTANFFGLGGHSLLGIQMITRIHKITDIKLELQDILEYPTVAELAAQLQRLKWIHDSQNIEDVPTDSQIII